MSPGYETDELEEIADFACQKEVAVLADYLDTLQENGLVQSYGAMEIVTQNFMSEDDPYFQAICTVEFQSELLRGQYQRVNPGNIAPDKFSVDLIIHVHPGGEIAATADYHPMLMEALGFEIEDTLEYHHEHDEGGQAGEEAAKYITIVSLREHAAAEAAKRARDEFEAIARQEFEDAAPANRRNILARLGSGVQP